MSFSEQDDDFKAEALELLERAEDSLLAFDKGAEFRPAFDAVFRCFHNLKGASGMMGLTDMQAHTHELENIWMRFKDSESVPKEYVSLFLKGIDAARSLLAGERISFDYAIGAAPPAPAQGPADPAIQEFLAECDEIVGRVSDSLQLIEARAHGRDTIEALYRDIHSLKGASYLFSYKAIGDLTHEMESSLEGVRSGSREPSRELVNALFKCIKAIENEVQVIRSDSKAGGSEARPKPVAAASEPQAAAREKDGEGNGSIRVPVG